MENKIYQKKEIQSILNKIGINSNGIQIIKDFIDWRWVAAFLIIPTIIFIWDINIDYGWIAAYYIVFIVLIVSGIAKYAIDKNRKNKI
jgi:hypothetical protein